MLKCHFKCWSLFKKKAKIRKRQNRSHKDGKDWIHPQASYFCHSFIPSCPWEPAHRSLILKMKTPFICKWRHFLHTGLLGVRKPRPKTPLSPERSPRSRSLSLLCLLTPHWLILFRLAWAGMHLMQFYVQAIWQWRVPSFCGINISFSIWMQIWDVAPGILMCFPREK